MLWNYAFFSRKSFTRSFERFSSDWQIQVFAHHCIIDDFYVGFGVVDERAKLINRGAHHVHIGFGRVGIGGVLERRESVGQIHLQDWSICRNNIRTDYCYRRGYSHRKNKEVFALSEDFLVFGQKAYK